MEHLIPSIVMIHQEIKWTEPLLSPPLIFFGLSQINGKLMAVGGRNKRNEAANEVPRTRRWKQTIPPMPTARWSPVILSLQSALVVAGGMVQHKNHTELVEFFKPDRSQWYRSSELPMDHSDVTLQLVAIDDKCYTLGGEHLNQIFVASVDNLIRYAVPAAANQVTYTATSGRYTKSAWKDIGEIETYAPAVLVLAGNMLTIEGESSIHLCRHKSTCTLLPLTHGSILVMCHLERQVLYTVSVVSPTEILVIGGWYI